MYWAGREKGVAWEGLGRVAVVLVENERAEGVWWVDYM